MYFSLSFFNVKEKKQKNHKTIKQREKNKKQKPNDIKKQKNNSSTGFQNQMTKI